MGSSNLNFYKRPQILLKVLNSNFTFYLLFIILGSFIRVQMTLVLELTKY